jgi:ankyrin repeat protein
LIQQCCTSHCDINETFCHPGIDTYVTILHTVCYYGQYDIMEQLFEINDDQLDLPINVNIQSDEGSTPLHYACSQDHGNIVEFFIRNE